MIKVTRIYDEHQERNGKRLYLIECKELSSSFFGGFTEYIAKENLPKLKQKFESFKQLQQYCRGEK